MPFRIVVEHTVSQAALEVLRDLAAAFEPPPAVDIGPILEQLDLLRVQFGSVLVALEGAMTSLSEQHDRIQAAITDVSGDIDELKALVDALKAELESHAGGMNAEQVASAVAKATELADSLTAVADKLPEPAPPTEPPTEPPAAASRRG